MHWFAIFKQQYTYESIFAQIQSLIRLIFVVSLLGLSHRKAEPVEDLRAKKEDVFVFTFQIIISLQRTWIDIFILLLKYFHSYINLLSKALIFWLSYILHFTDSITKGIRRDSRLAFFCFLYVLYVLYMRVLREIHMR